MSGIVVKAKTEAMKVRYFEPIFVRVYERDGVAIWSKIDGNTHDLTELNSDGLLYHVRSVFVPHGSANPLKDFTQEAAATIEMLCEALREVEAVTVRKQLPITAQINQVCRKALNKVEKS